MTIATAHEHDERPVDVVIGERVNTLMFRQKVSQTRLAPALGMTQSALSRKLYGRSQWTASDLLATARALDVPVTDLLPQVDSNHQPFDYPPPQVSDVAPCEVVELDAWRASVDDGERQGA